MRIESFQALVGANNAGKSNILKAIELLLTPTVSAKEQDFRDQSIPVVISGTFITSEQPPRYLTPLIFNGELFLERRLTLDISPETGRTRVTSEYWGNVGTPVDWWLSVDMIAEQEGSKPDWQAIAEAHELLPFVPEGVDKLTKASYKATVEQYLSQNTVFYANPNFQKLTDYKTILSHLPTFYLLPAITDYSGETDRRTSTTIFHRLMGIMGDRILRADERYSELEESLLKINRLLNKQTVSQNEEPHVARLGILEHFEDSLKQSVARLMPTVGAVHMRVTLDNVQELIAKGVTLEVDDGVRTDVLAKGNGLQRCVVFGLLQVLISIQRNEVRVQENVQSRAAPILLAIEEPELYIHPQGRRMIFKVLSDFAKTDQVIYSTHEPEFVDVANYHRIALVKKDTADDGTQICQCEIDNIAFQNNRERIQVLSRFTTQWNNIFFAKKVVLIEGEQDRIAILATARELRIFDELPEEIDWTIVVATNKDEIPKLQKVLNPFRIPYTVLLELDGQPEDRGKNLEILETLEQNNCVKIPTRLEDVCGHLGHFGNNYSAVMFFSDPNNITDALKQIVCEIFQLTQATTQDGLIP